ncbi:MAG TPA: dTDP-4-dehydrorhamnose reductase [Allosphingosinicella sp.]|jgi:dTDP-4-dehydrorhamnose reductase
MRVLVTGRQGQLALSLAERASDFPEISLQVIGRPGLDLERPETIAAAVESAAPDLVINAAAYTAVDLAESEPERAYRINATAAGEAAAAARRAGARFIQISTDYVFDGSAEGPYPETAPTNPLGVYGRSKLKGEERVLSEHPGAIVVRTAWVYSPFGKNFVKTMMALAAQRDELTVVADQWGNPSSASDLADGLLTLAGALREEEPERRIYHLAGSGRASWFDFAAHIMAELERLRLPSARVRPIRTEDWPTPAARPSNSVLDCSRFESNFGFRAPDWRRSSTAVIERLAMNVIQGSTPDQ